VESIVGAVRDAGSLRASVGLSFPELTSPTDVASPARDLRATDLKCAR
jgi:hypothetical protein